MAFSVYLNRLDQPSRFLHLWRNLKVNFWNWPWPGNKRYVSRRVLIIICYRLVIYTHTRIYGRRCHFTPYGSDIPPAIGHVWSYGLKSVFKLEKFKLWKVKLWRSNFKKFNSKMFLFSRSIGSARCRCRLARCVTCGTTSTKDTRHGPDEMAKNLIRTRAVTSP